MGWQDFTLIGSQDGEGPGILQVSGVQENDLIIAAGAAHTPYTYGKPALPGLSVSGLEVTKLIEQTSIPHRARWYPWEGYWYYYYYPYWYVYWWYWRYWWWYRPPWVVAKLAIWRAEANGDVSVEFSEPSGYGNVFKTMLRVWRPAVDLAADQALKSIMIAESAQGPVPRGRRAALSVTEGDLALAIGVDSVGYVASNIALSGVDAQELLNFNAQYAYRNVAMRLVRCRVGGTLEADYVGFNEGRALMRLVPHAEIVHTSIPTPVEPHIYVEIPAQITQDGQVIRPQWFEGLRAQYTWSNVCGLRKTWLKSPTPDPETGRANIVELWKLPEAAASAIPENEALVLTTRQEAEDRVTYHDKGW